MYYLFLKKESDLQKFRERLERVKENREKGKSPVFNELASAKTCFFESIPFNCISGGFMILGTLAINKIDVPEIIKIAIIMIINSFCYQVANVLFTLGKHGMRKNLCHRLGLEPNEDNIGAMESLEYQTV